MAWLAVSHKLLTLTLAGPRSVVGSLTQEPEVPDLIPGPASCFRSPSADLQLSATSESMCT